MPAFDSRLASSGAWVEPSSLPKYGNASEIAGNASDDVKQLTSNTLGAYGVGDQECFAHAVGKKIRVVEVNVKSKGQKHEASAISEVIVTKAMLNGAGMMHGGCLCYIIDNCASLPLVALGIAQHTNGVGVSQALNILFHSPASLGVCLQITSTSVTLGERIMSSRCEIIDKTTGKAVASALLSKMQPNRTKL